ncbi:hypothetical protein J4468_03090 [Candidatus Woesearchaeota archaeon]|nr:hypothetical protein [Candidatus Woesearchaeota archaeon]
MNLGKIKESVNLLSSTAQMFDILNLKLHEKNVLSENEEQERSDLLAKIKKLTLEIKGEIENADNR